MSVLKNFKNTPRSPGGGALSPVGGATGPPVAPVGGAHRSPEGRATGPLAFFLARDLVAYLTKKNYN